MNVLLFLTFLIQTVTCGYDRRIITTLKYSRYTITPSVVNGKPVGEGQFPFLVSIKEPMQKLEPGKTVWKNLCGGSIIGAKKVLTAAHCFESDNFYYAKHPEQLRVVAGNMNTELIHTGATETTDDGQWRRIARVDLHRGFSFPANDIALAEMDKPWVFNNKVNYIKLASQSNDYTGDCISAGYGRIGHDEAARTSPMMLMAQIEIIPRARCTLLWEMNMNKFICTSSAITDVARGDSGGPLVCMRTGDPEEVRKDGGVLVGVVSGKNFDMTTLYTRVSEYRYWINQDKRSIFPLSHAKKLLVDVNVFLPTIILIVLIYLLFYSQVPSRKMLITFFKGKSSRHRNVLVAAIDGSDLSIHGPGREGVVAFFCEADMLMKEAAERSQHYAV